jgi:hypothetical protein
LKLDISQEIQASNQLIRENLDKLNLLNSKLDTNVGELNSAFQSLKPRDARSVNSYNSSDKMDISAKESRNSCEMDISVPRESTVSMIIDE